MYEITIKLTEKEHEILCQTAEEKQLYPEATLKRWLRLGQLIEAVKGEGESIMLRRASGEVYDPFETLRLALPG